jgi:hypothetical protein
MAIGPVDLFRSNYYKMKLAEELIDKEIILESIRANGGKTLLVPLPFQLSDEEVQQLIQKYLAVKWDSVIYRQQSGSSIFRFTKNP